MKLPLKISVIACTVLSVFHNTVAAQGTRDQLVRSIDSIVTAGMGDNFPSITLAVVIDQKVAYMKAYGYADKKKKIPATTTTCYQVGSLTKTFTGNLVAKFIQANKLNLFDSLQKHFPPTVRFPTDSAGRHFTFFNLLTHTAGVPRYPANLERTDGDPIRSFSKQQLLNAINSMKLSHRVGSRWDYSNFGYGIIGAALENISGMSLDTLFRDHIFIPLKMTSTSLFLNPNIRSKLATPYRDDNPEIPTEPWNMGSLSAAGNIFSNIEDLSKFMLYQIAEEDAATKMQHDVSFSMSENTGYGLGCFTGFSKSKNARIIYHGGDVDGYASDMNILPDKKMGVVILTNCGRGREFSQISNAVFNLVFKFINGQ
jgi:serine-type D-Ala-D-Ala carboxypeptidase/endopeptidase